MRLKKTFTEVILTLTIITGTTFTYALLADIKVNPTDTLTSTLWNNLVDHSVPTGSVMAFDLETCPTGWTEYTALQGKFIRGADTGANNDPDFTSRVGGIGTRKIGSTQNDAFQNHTHNFGAQHSDNGDGQGYALLNFASFALYVDNWFVSSGYKTSTETRPTNVYLLYCRKD